MTNTQAILLNYMIEEPYIAADFLDCNDGKEYYEKWYELIHSDSPEAENISEYYGNACFNDLDAVREAWMTEYMEDSRTDLTFSLNEIGAILDIVLVQDWFEDPRDELGIPIVFEGEECCCGCDFDIDEPEEDPDPRFARWDREYGFSRS